MSSARLSAAAAGTAAAPAMRQRAGAAAAAAAPRGWCAPPQQCRNLVRRGSSSSTARVGRPAVAAAAATPETAATVAELERWVQQRAGIISSELQPELLDCSGRHRMLAKSGIAQGALLFSIPEALLLTANSGVRSPLCGQLIKQHELGEWQALVLHLLCERAAGADSFWAPYLAVLGDQRHHPLLWPPHVQAQLAGSSMLATLQARLEQVQQDTELLVAAGANELAIAAAWQQQTQTPLVDVGSVSWAAAVLLGRAFSLDLSEPDLPAEPAGFFGSWSEHGPACLALVPWADMCRHGFPAGGAQHGDGDEDDEEEAREAAMTAFDLAARAVVRTAAAPLAPGEEVLDCQGLGLSASDLLLDRGACDAGSSSDAPRYDAVPAAMLPGGLQPRGPRNAALLQALEALTGGPPVLSFIPSGPDSMALALVRAALAGDAELVSSAGWRLSSKAGDVGACAKAMGRLTSTPLGLSTEQAVVALLQRVVDAALAAYPSSMADDEAELAQLRAADGGDQDPKQLLRASILRALISEKTALRGSASVLSQWASQLAELAGARARGGVVNADKLSAVYERRE